MKVKELIKQLENCDGEEEILMSADEEGNWFKPVCEVCRVSGEEDMNGNKLKGYILYPE